ncbi:MAG: hypothetical protein JNL81_15635 [Hyphomonadaceae bacterium]|nr:hypothetical protein [Hyphomonadaceae bacterium]
MALQRSFSLDKESIMRAFGLTGAEREAVKTAQDREIKKMLGKPQVSCFLLGLTRTSVSE